MSKGRTLPIVLILSVIFTLLLVFVFTSVPFFNNLLPFDTGDGGPIQSGQNVTLEYWGIYEDPEVMESLISKYNETHPGVKINYVDRNFEDDISRYKSTLLTRLNNGDGPDIFRMHSTWTREYINEISLNNRSLELEEFRKRFYPVAETQCVLTDGRVVCIPLTYDGLVLFYNQELFGALGIGEPRTWDEVRDAALKLTQREENGSIRVAGLALGTADNVAYSSDILALMFLQSGIKIPDGIDTDSAAAALTFYTNFVRVDDVWDNSFTDSIEAFASQRAAMAFGTSREIEEILSINPTLQLGILPVPQLPSISGGTTNDTWASFWVESVSKDSSDSKQRAAWDFLEWMSQPEQQLYLYEQSASKYRVPTIPSNREVQSEVLKNPYLNNIVKQAVYSKSSLVADQVGNDRFSVIFKDAINEITGPSARRANFRDALEAAKADYLKLLN